MSPRQLSTASTLPATARWENEGGAALGPQALSSAPKKLVIFDLDGTLAESKSAVDPEMARLLVDLLHVVDVAVISGGDWPQFEKQLISQLPPAANWNALSLLPTCGTKFYEYVEDWCSVYSEDFTVGQREEIIVALEAVSASYGRTSSSFAKRRTWGEVIEDRGGQITFSALGQDAPIEAKKKWDPDFVKRTRMRELLAARIPDFSVRLGGTTSIDITKPGIDKAYGIRKLRDMLSVAIHEMVFVGDAIFPGGNDYPAKEAGVACVQVRDSHETKRLIETMLACAGGVGRQDAT